MSPAADRRREPGSAGDSVRLFFAVLPDVAARRSLALLAREIARATGGRATPAENLHLTLAFLGAVSPSRARTLDAIGAQAASAAPPFSLTLDRVGHFRHAGVAWIRPEQIAPALQQLHRALGDALDAAELAFDRRPFNPHLTLARRCVRPPAAHAAAGATWCVEALALMVSETLPAGPVYRVHASWHLRGKQSAGASP